MTDLSALAHKMQLGTFPEWSPKLIARNGDAMQQALADRSDLSDLEREIMEAVEEFTGADAPITAGGGLAVLLARLDAKASQLSAVRDILVSYGALYADDQETNAVDMLRLLLPPVL